MDEGIGAGVSGSSPDEADSADDEDDTDDADEDEVGGGAGGGDENCAIEGLKAAFGNRVLLPTYPAKQ